MSPRRSLSIASAQAAAMSLASAAKASGADIDFIASLDPLVFLEAMLWIDHMGAVREVELPAVPRADDMHVVLVEGLAEMDAARADLLHHLRQLEPLARRPALMRAEIAVGVVAALMADDADLDAADG